MKCIILLMVLAVIAVANAGKVVIAGECIDCNRPTTSGSGGKSGSSSSTRHSATTTPKSKTSARGKAAKKSNSDESDEDDFMQQITGPDGFVMQQGSRRTKRQWYRYNNGVHTYDASNLPGTIVRNADCRNCNINGGPD